jgi:hypothetical protein
LWRREFDLLAWRQTIQGIVEERCAIGSMATKFVGTSKEFRRGSRRRVMDVVAIGPLACRLITTLLDLLHLVVWKKKKDETNYVYFEILFFKALKSISSTNFIK